MTLEQIAEQIAESAFTGSTHDETIQAILSALQSVQAEGEQARERLRLERDAARDQFDTHVEWASNALAELEAQLATVRADTLREAADA